MTVFWKTAAIAFFPLKIHEDAVKEIIYNYHSTWLWHIVSNLQNESQKERKVDEKENLLFFNDLRRTKEKQQYMLRNFKNGCKRIRTNMTRE